MSYVTPEFQLIDTKDAFISPIYGEKKKKTTAGEAVEITGEINEYLTIPYIDGNFQLKQMEQRGKFKFSKNTLQLATLPGNRKMFIQDDGTITVK